MKGMMGRMMMKPRDLKMNVENEPKTHKYKVALFALLMAGISGGYQQYYDMLQWRMGQIQMRFMAGDPTVTVPVYHDKYDADMLQKRNTLAFLKAKNFKDLTYIANGWKSRKISDNAYDPRGDNTARYYEQTIKSSSAYESRTEDKATNS